MYRQVTSWWAWERDAALVPGTYLDVVEESGGEALLLAPRAEGAPAVESGSSGSSGRSDESGPSDRYRRVVAALDGLVLIGGGDLDATLYGETADARNGGTNGRRDDLELGLLVAALQIDLPILAVCRGLQVLNVSLGGSLVQQLPDRIGSSRHQPRPGAFGSVTVVTEEGSRMRRLIGERADVLCSHHQAVDRLGEGLVVTARSEDGVVEAVELPGHQFVVGVQWHPEETGDRRLFGALVAAAAGRSDQGGSTTTAYPSIPASPSTPTRASQTMPSTIPAIENTPASANTPTTKEHA
jgi:gamma-glutamyl-gamma-aminobutyrate hydrolase PuuD